MADILTALDAPGVVTVGEGEKAKTHTLKVWSTSQWLPILAKLLDKRLESLRKNLKAFNVKPAEAAYYIMQEECRVPDPNDAHAYSLTMEGLDVVLRESLVRGGTPEPEATAVLEAIPTKRKIALVIHAAGVYEVKKSPTASTQTQANKGLGLGDPGQTVPEQPDTLGGGSQQAPANPPSPTP